MIAVVRNALLTSSFLFYRTTTVFGQNPSTTWIVQECLEHVGTIWLYERHASHEYYFIVHDANRLMNRRKNVVENKIFESNFATAQMILQFYHVNGRSKVINII